MRTSTFFANAKVYKTNMTDILDLPVCIKAKATPQYYRDLESRAKARGIWRRDGMDACGWIWFEVDKNGKRIRYTITSGAHDLDTIAV